MITTFREAQCLLMLYRACPDEATRQRALKLIPELADLTETLTYEEPRARRRRLDAYNSFDNNHHLGHRFVVCRDEDIEEHKRDFALSFDLARGVMVESRDA